jgi:hypothetical protein
VNQRLEATDPQNTDYGRLCDVWHDGSAPWTQIVDTVLHHDNTLRRNPESANEFALHQLGVNHKLVGDAINEAMHPEIPASVRVMRKNVVDGYEKLPAAPSKNPVLQYPHEDWIHHESVHMDNSRPAAQDVSKQPRVISQKVHCLREHRTPTLLAAAQVNKIDGGVQGVRIALIGANQACRHMVESKPIGKAALVVLLEAVGD